MTQSFDYEQFGASRVPELNFLRSTVLRFGFGHLDQILEVESPRRCIVVAEYVRDHLGAKVQSDGQRDLLDWLRKQIISRSGSADGGAGECAFAPMIGQGVQPKSRAAQHV